MTSRFYFAPESSDGERVDAVLAQLTGLSRAKVASLIDDGAAHVDGKPARRSDRVAAGARLDIDLPEPAPAEPLPTPVDMDVVFEDDDIIVINKPPGVAAHPSVGWDGPDVVGALIAAGVRVSTSGLPERKGIVQRLDVGTSGLMTVAKSERAYSVLKQAFRDRAVTKVYHALVQGYPFPDAGTIDAPIARDHRHSWKMAVQPEGRESVTHYETLEMLKGCALLEVHLETGRTHQIRVHMSAMNHPLVGDPLYGSDPTLSAELGIDRQWLHAVSIGFRHPTLGHDVIFTVDYPSDLQRALDQARDAWL